MLTGDAKPVADQVAQSLGIDQVYAELLPAGKVELKVSDEELAKRKAEYTPSQKKSPYGILRRYASLVTSASNGARYRDI